MDFTTIFEITDAFVALTQKISQIMTTEISTPLGDYSLLFLLGGGLLLIFVAKWVLF